MNIWTDSNWFAIQARPHQEQLGAASISRLDLEVFLPIVRQMQSVCGVPRAVTKPLFLGYFFSKFAPIVSIDLVRYSPGILRVVGTSRFPIPLEPEAISSIRARLQPDGLIRLEPREFRPGDVVRIEHGPFEGFMGRVERETDDGRRIAILLEALQQARLLLEKSWVSAAAPV